MAFRKGPSQWNVLLLIYRKAFFNIWLRLTWCNNEYCHFLQAETPYIVMTATDWFLLSKLITRLVSLLMPIAKKKRLHKNGRKLSQTAHDAAQNVGSINLFIYKVLVNSFPKIFYPLIIPDLPLLCMPLGKACFRTNSQSCSSYMHIGFMQRSYYLLLFIYVYGPRVF